MSVSVSVSAVGPRVVGPPERETMSRDGAEMMVLEDGGEVFSCELVSRHADAAPVPVLLELRLSSLKLCDAASKQILQSIPIASLIAWSTRDSGMLHLYTASHTDGSTIRWTLRTSAEVEIAAACNRSAQSEALRSGANAGRMRGASIEESSHEGRLLEDATASEATFLVEVDVLGQDTSPARLEVSEDGITLLRDLATGCNVQHFPLEDVASWKATPNTFLWYVPNAADAAADDVESSLANYRKLEVFTAEGAAIEAALRQASAAALDADDEDDVDDNGSSSRRQSCSVQ